MDIKYPIFPKFKKIQIILAEGGGEGDWGKKNMDFFLSLYHSFIQTIPLTKIVTMQLDVEGEGGGGCIKKSFSPQKKKRKIISPPLIALFQDTTSDLMGLN